MCAIERMIAGEHLVEHHSAAILIAARIDDAAGLLRGHIANGTAHCDSSTKERARLQRASNAKVGDNQTVIFLVQQNIFRLDIAVNDRARAGMSIEERL